MVATMVKTLEQKSFLDMSTRTIFNEAHMVHRNQKTRAFTHIPQDLSCDNQENKRQFLVKTSLE